MDGKTVAENKAWYTLQGWPLEHSPESGKSVYIRIFVRDIIPWNYNAVVHVTVRVTRYSREMMSVSYALTMWRSIETIWYSAQAEWSSMLSLSKLRSLCVASWLHMANLLCLQLLPFMNDFSTEWTQCCNSCNSYSSTRVTALLPTVV